jgi:hypothetical protein
VAALELVAPVRAQDERRHVLQPPRQVVEQLAGRGVRPVDVVDDEQRTAVAGGGAEHRDDRLEQPQLRLRRVARRRSRARQRKLREEQAELPRGAAQLGVDLLGRAPREVVPERLDERQVRHRHLGLGAAAPQHVPPERPRALGELLSEPRLPHPRLALDQEEPAASVALDREQRVLERRELGVAADERVAEGLLEHDRDCRAGAFLRRPLPARPRTR